MDHLFGKIKRLNVLIAIDALGVKRNIRRGMFRSMTKAPPQVSLRITNHSLSALASCLFAIVAIIFAQPVSAQDSLDGFKLQGLPVTDTNGNTTSAYKYRPLGGTTIQETAIETKNVDGKVIKQVEETHYSFGTITITGQADDSMEKGGWTAVKTDPREKNAEWKYKYGAQHHLKISIYTTTNPETGEVTEETTEYRQTKEGEDVPSRKIIEKKDAAKQVYEKEVRLYDASGTKQTGGSVEDKDGKQIYKWNPKKGDNGGWEHVSFTPSSDATTALEPIEEINTASVSSGPEGVIGYLGAEYGGYAMHANGTNWTSGAGSFGGAFALPIDSFSSVQLDADYSRLNPGQGAPGTNAWDGDAHYTYKLDDIPIGGLVGGFSNHGTATWGGGIETIIPLDRFFWESQAVYAHTGTGSTDLWGGRTELRYFPTDDLRFTANLGAQHTSSNFAPTVTSIDNIYSFGLGAEGRLMDSPWSAFVAYDHTHFGQSGLNSDGFTIGLRYNFGETLKARETQGPAFTNFTQLLGVGYKF